MKATNVLLGAASYLVAAQLLAGEAVFYITEEGSAVRDLAVSVNGQKKLVGSSGFVTFDIGAGNYRVEPMIWDRHGKASSWRSRMKTVPKPLSSGYAILPVNSSAVIIWRLLSKP